MYTWILVFLLCFWKLETLFLKLKDQSYRLCIFNKQNNEKRLKKKKNEIEPDLNPHLLNAKHILLNETPLGPPLLDHLNQKDLF